MLNFDRAHNSQISKWRIICNTLGRHLKVSAADAAAAASLLCLALTHTYTHSRSLQSPFTPFTVHNQLHSGSHTTHLEAVAFGGNIAGLQDATTQHSFRLREGSATTSQTAFAGGQLPRFMSSSRNGSTRTVTTL